MTKPFDAIAARSSATGRISEHDILALRRECWPDGRIDAGEADMIIALNDSLREPSAEWADFLVEALTEFVVNQTEPRGYVSELNAAWLMERVERDRRLCSMTECELVVRIFEKAQNAPDALKNWALEQIERAVLTGEGPTRRGGALEKGNVNATEAQLLRRLIFAQASERPGAVGPREAEMLFALKDVTLGADNAPEWKRLFVQGVGNFLMGYASPHAQLTRERAGELEAAMRRATPGMLQASAAGLRSATRLSTWRDALFHRGDAADPRSAAVAEAAQVTSSERAWLMQRIDADGQLDEYEQALLDFIAEEAGAA